jgi:hypothetical protein
MYVWKWHVDSRARLVLVPLLGLHLRRRPNFNLSLLLSLGTVCKAAMATSMEVDGTALGQPATLHSVPQVHEQPIMHTGRPLSNGRPPIPISAQFGDCCSTRWTHAMAQAPRIANPSEKSQSKYTFGGLREILGCMWGVRQFRWTQRDIPLKSVSHRIHTPSPLWTDLLKL